MLITTSKNTQIVQNTFAGDFNAEFGPGIGAGRLGVGPYTLNESKKRGQWMKQWLMIRNFVALNTMHKQATSRSPKGQQKRLDYVLIDRKKHEILQRRRSKCDGAHRKRSQMCRDAFHISRFEEERLPK